jgi:dienelactone hydrolase
MVRNRPVLVALLLSLSLVPVGAAAEPTGGFRPEVAVTRPTRLDWKFVAAAFGPKAARLPASYSSLDQRYQLDVPPAYDPDHAWPLVVFISPGDDPLGWRFWQKPCTEAGALFCAAYGAGNNCPPGERVRIVLDVLDDVRRHYHVDPDQTYLTGFSGGGRMACTIAFALPEYFGGVAPVCGTNPLNDLAYLRHRVRDRLSVAFVTGTDDFNRRENEVLMQPLFQTLGIRSRLWVVPGLGHAVPGPEVLGEVYRWLAAGGKRRRADREAHPGLAVRPNEVPTPQRQASRQVEEAEAALRDPKRTWEAVALLEGTVARFGRTEAGEQARRLLDEVRANRTEWDRATRESAAEECRLLTAEAEGLERLGAWGPSLATWRRLLKRYPDTAAGKTAAEAVVRLEHAPYLGVAFVGETAAVSQVDPKGPAAKAGLKAGDVLAELGGIRVGSLSELRRLLKMHEAGEKVTVAVRRDGKSVTVTVELGSLPAGDGGP